MKRRRVTSLFLALAALAFALGGRPHTVQADQSSVDWDVSITDPIDPNFPWVCPANNNNGTIDVDECPTTESHFDIGTVGKQYGFFDMATEIIKTGPPRIGPGADLDGDTLPEPTAGVVKLSDEVRGATTGQVTFTLKNNVVLGNISNIDDAPVNADNTVTGQPAVCGGANTGSFAPQPFYLWAADNTGANFVSYLSTNPAVDNIPQTQEDRFSAGEDCMGTGGTPNGMPDGIDCTPSALPAIQAAIGLPIANYVDRFYGIANLPIGAPTFAFKYVDVNFLYYNMVSVPSIQGYLQVAVVQYPGRPLADPMVLGYDPLQQTVTTCPPFTANVQMYGIATRPTYPPSKARVVVGPGTFDFLEMKSTNEDYDGDAIPDYLDRCSFDPASGAAGGAGVVFPDTDGDFLTGLCESLGDGNGEGAAQGPNVNNPQDVAPAGWNIAPPWDSGQDVDGDGYVNEVDNCPIIADRVLNGPGVDYQRDTDVDGVGDVCEIDLAAGQGWPADAYLIPGNGRGYPGSPAIGDMYTAKAPGYFVDRDNVCSDPFVVGQAEPAFDAGRWCAGFDTIANGRGADPNPPKILGRMFADSNDNGMPDLLDWPAGGQIEFIDFSDTDNDGQTDACEAFMGSDALDSSSKPAGPPPNLDCNNNGTPDASDPNPFAGLNPDADRDGCARSEEQPSTPSPSNKTPGGTAAGGSSYQDSAWYDFYDVPVPSLIGGPGGTYSGSVTLGDALAVLSYVPSRLNPPSWQYVADMNANGIMDGMEYDRSPSFSPSPPNDAGPPDGAVALGDALAALAQSGLKCTLGSGPF